MLVLYGNNPRFPWEPSTTMLTNRLEALQRLRCLTGTDPTSLPPTPTHRQGVSRDGRTHHQIFAHPGEPQRGSTLLTRGDTAKLLVRPRKT